MLVGDLRDIGGWGGGGVSSPPLLHSPDVCSWRVHGYFPSPGRSLRDTRAVP